MTLRQRLEEQIASWRHEAEVLLLDARPGISIHETPSGAYRDCADDLETCLRIDTILNGYQP